MFFKKLSKSPPIESVIISSRTLSVIILLKWTLNSSRKTFLSAYLLVNGIIISGFTYWWKFCNSFNRFSIPISETSSVFSFTPKKWKSYTGNWSAYLTEIFTYSLHTSEITSLFVHKRLKLYWYKSPIWFISSSLFTLDNIFWNCSISNW